MGKQFEKVNMSRGAPMGRVEWTTPPTKAHSVRVFRVNIDSGGYDDGGAYWGIGKPLFCATDGAEYRMFTRAQSRAAAVAEFRLAPYLLRHGIGEHLAKMRETMAGYVAAGVEYPARSTVDKLTKLGY